MGQDKGYSHQEQEPTIQLVDNPVSVVCQYFECHLMTNMHKLLFRLYTIQISKEGLHTNKELGYSLPPLICRIVRVDSVHHNRFIMVPNVDSRIGGFVTLPKNGAHRHTCILHHGLEGALYNIGRQPTKERT